MSVPIARPAADERDLRGELPSEIDVERVFRAMMADLQHVDIAHRSQGNEFFNLLYLRITAEQRAPIRRAVIV